jgi:hypothetical protein
MLANAEIAGKATAVERQVGDTAGLRDAVPRDGGIEFDGMTPLPRQPCRVLRSILVHECGFTAARVSRSSTNRVNHARVV